MACCFGEVLTHRPKSDKPTPMDRIGGRLLLFFLSFALFIPSQTSIAAPLKWLVTVELRDQDGTVIQSRPGVMTSKDRLFTHLSLLGKAANRGDEELDGLKIFVKKGEKEDEVAVVPTLVPFLDLMVLELFDEHALTGTKPVKLRKAKKPLTLKRLEKSKWRWTEDTEIEVALAEADPISHIPAGGVFYRMEKPVGESTRNLGEAVVVDGEKFVGMAAKTYSEREPSFSAKPGGFLYDPGKFSVLVTPSYLINQTMEALEEDSAPTPLSIRDAIAYYRTWLASKQQKLCQALWEYHEDRGSDRNRGGNSAYQALREVHGPLAGLMDSLSGAEGQLVAIDPVEANKLLALFRTFSGSLLFVTRSYATSANASWQGLDPIVNNLQDAIFNIEGDATYGGSPADRRQWLHHPQVAFYGHLYMAKVFILRAALGTGDSEFNLGRAAELLGAALLYSEITADKKTAMLLVQAQQLVVALLRGDDGQAEELRGEIKSKGKKYGEGLLADINRKAPELQPAAPSDAKVPALDELFGLWEARYIEVELPWPIEPTDLLRDVEFW